MPDARDLPAGYLVTAAPHWRDPVTLAVQLPTERIRGATGGEERRPLGETLRCRMRWQSTMTADEFAVYRNAAQVAEDRSWVVPVWPLAVAGSDWTGSPVTGGLLVAWQDGWGDWEAGASIGTPSDWDWIAPAVVGRLEITGEALGAAAGNYLFEFTESSEAGLAIVPAAVSWDTGAALADASTPKVWPFSRTRWDRRPAAGEVSLTATRRDIGFGRQTADAYFGGAPERPIACETVLPSLDDVGRFLRWILDVADVGAHWIPSLTQTATLAGTAAAGATYCDVTDGAAIGANRMLLLTTGQASEWVKVSSVAGNRLNLSAALVASWGPMATVQLAILARHTRNEFSLAFSRPGVAVVQTAWREVAAEYAPATGETRGTTLGALPRTAYLFTFSVDRIGATEVHRLTSYESDVTIGGNTWTSARVEHGEIRQTLRLDRDELSVSIRWDSWLEVLLPGRTDGVVRLTITRCQVTAGVGSSSAAIFTGDVSGFTTSGPFVELRFRGASGLFERVVPRRLMQRGCNWVVYSAPCGLDVADWTFSGTVALASGSSVIVDSITGPGALPTAFGFSNWFAAGYLVRADGSHHYVLTSSAISGGQISLALLVEPSTPFAVGEVLSIIPGCDGTAGTCKAYASPTNTRGKFDNFSNFGGFPYIPDANPSFTPRKKTTGTSGKKGQQ